VIPVENRFTLPTEPTSVSTAKPCSRQTNQIMSQRQRCNLNEHATLQPERYAGNNALAWKVTRWSTILCVDRFKLDVFEERHDPVDYLRLVDDEQPASILLLGLSLISIIAVMPLDFVVHVHKSHNTLHLNCRMPARGDAVAAGKLFLH
jgi:hypothetical protein